MVGDELNWYSFQSERPHAPSVFQLWRSLWALLVLMLWCERLVGSSRGEGSVMIECVKSQICMAACPTRIFSVAGARMGKDQGCP